MGLSMRARQAVTQEVAPRYHKAPKKQKGAILDEFGSPDRLSPLLRGLYPQKPDAETHPLVQGQPVVLVASPGKRSLRKRRGAGLTTKRS
jgi:hypothetical protein